MNSMNSFMSKTYHLKGLLNIDFENFIWFTPPSEMTKIITSLKLTKQKIFSSISISTSNISISVSFRKIFTQVLNRPCYVYIGSANHPFKFLVPLNHTVRFLVPLNTIFYSYAKIKEKLK